jgi:hypothetical protein
VRDGREGGSKVGESEDREVVEKRVGVASVASGVGVERNDVVEELAAFDETSLEGGSERGGGRHENAVDGGGDDFVVGVFQGEGSVVGRGWRGC